MSQELSDPKAVVLRYFELLNTGQVDAFDSVLAQSYVDHYDLTSGRGPEPEKEFVRMVRIAFPDASWTIEDIVVDGNTVAVRLTFEGTQQGEFLGIAPRGRSVAMPAMVFMKVSEGKIGDTWLLRNRPLLIEQLTG